MKSRMTKLASAAAVIIIIGLAIGLWPQASLTGKAYGLTEALTLYKQAGIVHIKGWSFFVKDTAEGPELSGLPREEWIDRERGCFRTLRPAGSFAASPKETPNTYLTVSDGHYMMETYYGEQNASDELTRGVEYRQLSPFQQRLQMQTMQNILDYYDVSDVEGFTKTGSETLGGEILDIWQGEVTAPGNTVPYKKLMVWLSPASGEIKQIFRWTNAQKNHNEVGWLLASISNFEYEVTPPKGCFDMAPPPGAECKNTKETAPRMGLGMYEDRQTFYTCVAFNLNNRGIILVWHAHLEGQGSQEHLFKNLEPGGPLPELPAQITELVPWPMKEDVVYVGRHLAYSQKADKFYEWSLYVPNKDVAERKLFTSLKVRKEFRNCSERDFPSRPNLVADEVYIGSEEEFDSWVLGAIAELSDDGIVPTQVTYHNVMQLTEVLRQSIQNK